MYLRPEHIDGGRVRAIFLVMLGGGSISEVADAFTLVVAQGADPLHVAQHQRLRTGERLFVCLLYTSDAADE